MKNHTKLLGKYRLSFHWSANSYGFTGDERRARWFQTSVEMFDVQVFADDDQYIGLGRHTYRSLADGPGSGRRVGSHRQAQRRDQGDASRSRFGVVKTVLP
jgi:hypothetical protein